MSHHRALPSYHPSFVHHDHRRHDKEYPIRDRRSHAQKEELNSGRLGEQERASKAFPERSRFPGSDRFENSRGKPSADAHSRGKVESYEVRGSDLRPVPVITSVIHQDVRDNRLEAVEAKLAEDKATESRRGQFQATCDVKFGRDFTVHLDFPVFEDYDKLLENLNYLRRLGRFHTAKEHVKNFLRDQLSHPYVFVQYADLLLDMGDYKSFEQLDPSLAFDEKLDSRPEFVRTRQSETTRHFYVRPTRNYRPPWKDQPALARNRSPTIHLEGSLTIFPFSSMHSEVLDPPSIARAPKISRKTQYVGDGLYLLRWNWRLLKTLYLLHRNGTVNEALDGAQFVLDNLVLGPEIGSTEIQIMSLVLRIFGKVGLWLPDIIHREVQDSLETWTKWSELYKSLLAQGRIWDFRDIFLSAISAFGPEWTCGKFFPATPWRESLLDNWILQERDESTSLAQLDILTSMILDLNLPNQGLGQMEWLERDSQFLAEFIMNTYPGSMTSRPFLRWIVVKAAGTALTQQLDANSDASYPNEMFKDWPGCFLTFPGWIWLPIYIPRGTEIPPWSRPEITDTANDPVRLALTMATQLNDYTTQSLCLKVLILRCQQPQKLFAQLCDLQNSSQGDMEGYLWTCLSRYLIDRDKQSQKQLLSELKEFENWTKDYELRSPLCYLAKDCLETALFTSINGRDQAPPLAVGLNFYPWLPDSAFLGHESVPGAYPAHSPRRDRIRTYDKEIHPDYSHEGYGKQKSGQPANPAKPHRFSFLRRTKQEPRSGNDDVVEVIEELGHRPVSPVSPSELRAFSPTGHDEWRRRNRRGNGGIIDLKYTRQISSVNGSSPASSDSDLGPSNFLAAFPYMPVGLDIDMTSDEVEGKRIVLEVRDEKTGHKDLDATWVKTGSTVEMTLKATKAAGRKGRVRRRSTSRPRRKGKGVRRRSYSRSSLEYSGVSSYSDDADSEGDDSLRAHGKIKTKVRHEPTRSHARDDTEDRRARQRATEVDPEPGPENDPAREEHVVAGPSTARPDISPLPRAENEPDGEVGDA